MVRQADLDRIRRRLDTLPMAQRAVFLLCRIGGLDFDQIGWRLLPTRSGPCPEQRKSWRWTGCDGMRCGRRCSGATVAVGGPVGQHSGRTEMSEAVPAELTEELIGQRLDALPALSRRVFLLHHLDGLDVAAIGARLGVEIEAVEEELARAMRALIWGNGGEDDPSGI